MANTLRSGRLLLLAWREGSSPVLTPLRQRADRHSSSSLKMLPLLPFSHFFIFLSSRGPKSHETNSLCFLIKRETWGFPPLTVSVIPITLFPELNPNRKIQNLTSCYSLTFCKDFFQMSSFVRGQIVSFKLHMWMCQRPVPQNVITFGGEVFTGVVKLKEVYQGGAIIQYYCVLIRFCYEGLEYLSPIGLIIFFSCYLRWQ